MSVVWTWADAAYSKTNWHGMLEWFAQGVSSKSGNSDRIDLGERGLGCFCFVAPKRFRGFDPGEFAEEFGGNIVRCDGGFSYVEHGGALFGWEKHPDGALMRGYKFLGVAKA